MNRDNLKSMSVDELWSLHELVVSVLARKISSEQAELEQKLRELGQKTPDSLNKVSPRAAPIPAGFSEVQKSCPAVGNLGRSRETTTLGDCRTQGREKAR